MSDYFAIALVGFLLSSNVLALGVGIWELTAEGEARLHAPCSEFANWMTSKMPARCFEYYHINAAQ